MAYNIQFIVDSFRELMGVRQAWGRTDASRFALAWMVGARMIQLGMLPEGSRPISLAVRKTWVEAHPQVGATCADLIWPKGVSDTAADAEAMQAIRIVSRLLETAPEFYWHVPDLSWHLGLNQNDGRDSLSPEVCDLLFCALKAPLNARVWIPFDTQCQLLARARRLGYAVESASPLQQTDDVTTLYKAALGIFDESSDAPQGETNARSIPKTPAIELDYLIAVPPEGYKLTPEWYSWLEALRSDSAHPRTDASLVDKSGVNRADSWAVAALWPSVAKRAVYLVGPATLFSRGKEQRLRETMIHRRADYPIELIAALPRSIGFSYGTGEALVVIDQNAALDIITMADLSETSVRTTRSSYSRNSRTLDIDSALLCLKLENAFDRLSSETEDISDPRELGASTSSGQAKDIALRDIEQADCILLPSRYLQPEMVLTGSRKPLSDLVDVIRAPVQSDEPFSVAALEVGLPDLGSWQPIAPRDLFESSNVRKVNVKNKKLEDLGLEPNDIVLSVKGSIGRTGLIGIEARLVDDDVEYRLVVSGNCIALRPKESQMAKYLLVYFRSAEFKKQLERISVGSVISHVTPRQIMGVQVPVPDAKECDATVEKYQSFVELEQTINSAKAKMDSMLNDLWDTDS